MIFDNENYVALLSFQVATLHVSVPLPCFDWFAEVEEKVDDGTLYWLE